MNVAKKLESISRLASSEDLTGQQKLSSIKQTLLIGENRSKEEILSSVFMVVAGISLIVFMVIMEATYYQTQEIGDWKMRAILALAGGAMSVGFTGNINIKLHWIQASGSLAVVLLFYFVTPISMEREVPDTSGTSIGIDNGLSTIDLSLIKSVYAQDIDEDNLGIQMNESVSNEKEMVAADSKAPEITSSDVGEDAVTTGYDVPENEVIQEQKGYIYRVVYPIGIDELKNKSVQVSEAFENEQDAGNVKVYSVGSMLRAPINAFLYDGEYDIEVRYHRLIDHRSISSIEEILEAISDGSDTVVKTVVTNPRNSDIEISITPK